MHPFLVRDNTVMGFDMDKGEGPAPAGLLRSLNLTDAILSWSPSCRQTCS
jgi:hypothetical protein